MDCPKIIRGTLRFTRFVAVAPRFRLRFVFPIQSFAKLFAFLNSKWINVTLIEIALIPKPCAHVYIQTPHRPIRNRKDIKHTHSLMYSYVYIFIYIVYCPQPMRRFSLAACRLCWSGNRMRLLIYNSIRCRFVRRPAENGMRLDSKIYMLANIQSITNTHSGSLMESLRTMLKLPLHTFG